MRPAVALATRVALIASVARRGAVIGGVVLVATSLGDLLYTTTV